MNLREKNGYTYGASSFFNYHRGAGPFFVTSSVRTDTTSNALREMFKEIDGMQTSPVSDAELKMAKDATALSLAGLFETTQASVETAAGLFTYDLQLDFFNTLPSKVDSVTVSDVERVAKQYFVPRKMFVVVVGDRQKIESGLEELPLGKIQLTNLDGTPASAVKVTSPGANQ